MEKQDLAQMRKTRQADLDAWQARMDVYHEERMARMAARQAETDAWHSRIVANLEKMMARRDAWLTDVKNDRKETMACSRRDGGTS
jgi:hypothetical protein